MAKYLDIPQLTELISIRNQLFEHRCNAWLSSGIDLFENDTLSSLSLYEIISVYDPSFNINFSRNGEDAISNDVIIENKCSTVKPSKKGIIPNTSFQFHAMGDLSYPRYVLAVRNKDDLSIERLYDIKETHNTQLIQDHLHNERNRWLEKCNGTPKKYDVITLKEGLLKCLSPVDIMHINNCTVVIG